MLTITTLLLLGGCYHGLPPTLVPDDVQTVRTADGWTLPLRRYPGPGEPVLLVHGMGVNHYNYDYREEVSLAAWLRARGWDVWVPTLRGDSDAIAPTAATREHARFSDMATLDLPEHLRRVTAITGKKPAWVGHSMGGMLLYATLSLEPDAVSAGVTVGSPVRFDVMPRIHGLGTHSEWLPENGVMHNRRFVRASRFLGRLNPAYGILGNRRNFDWDVTWGVLYAGIEDLSYDVGREVDGWLTRGFLSTEGGTPWVVPGDVPMLVIAGAHDDIAPWPNVAPACDVLRVCTFRLFGTMTGASIDYGHGDLLLGKAAPLEVYPVMEAFLQQHAGRSATRAVVGVQGSEGQNEAF